MESLLVSTGVVALAEIGDKTQLLAFIQVTLRRQEAIAAWQANSRRQRPWELG